MLRRGTFTVAMLAFPAFMRSQSRSSGSQKVALVTALTAIRNEAERMRNAHKGSPGHVAELADSMFRSARSLANTAEEWSPKNRQEGALLVSSVERSLEALEGAPTTGPALEEVLRVLADDLSAKASHCRAKGLAALQRVAVVTKRQSVHEVKGLQILYIEQFLAGDTTTKPYEFRRFSSPAVDELAPGQYLFWAKEPGENGRAGARTEARIGNGSPAVPIQLLAP